MNGQVQETVIRNTFAENQNFSIDNEIGAATKVEVTMDNHPHDLISRMWFYSPGNWSEGLPLATEDLAGGVRKRWTRTVWTQDNTSLAYALNPRVVESKVGDAANVKRTEIEYHPVAQGSPIAQFGLVKAIRLYDGTTGMLLKRATSEYKLDTSYTSRRVIGLPFESKLFDGDENLMSKVTYDYDQYNFGDSALEQNISSVIQHDNTNYGASFITGRGNLTATTRHDVIDASTVSSTVKYNTAGAPVAQIDPLGRTVKINYTDAFNDDPANTLNRNTFAYPTKIADPAGNFSKVQYRFDIGANIWAKSPEPAGNTTGKETTRTFDSIGRLSKETLVNSSAYTRYEYPQSQIYSKIFTTIVDANGNGAEAADEVLTESLTDGAGRVRQSRTEMPNSAGGWSGQKIEYDILGRVEQKTAPTEINAGWTPTGDDQNWLWTQQEYDWKGRVTKITNTDGTFKTMNYEGCGCAGGEETIIEGEEIKETNWQGNLTATLGKRQQRIYSDTLGRTVKTKVFDWNGNVYSTVVNTFNGRDQVTQARHYAGDENSSTFQDTTFSYDGHGRLQTRHLPEQAANTNMSYEYYADDQIKKVTDARGATTNYEYEQRGLLERITHGVPANNENLTPWVYRVDKSGSSGLLVVGQNFAANIEVVVRGTSTGQELARYSGGQLTRGTEGNRQTVTFQITEQPVLNALNEPSLALQIVNSDTDQQSSFLSLNVINSQTVGQSFGSPETSIPAAPVSYEYDAAGNRTLMEDELGAVTYSYDQLSRLTGETRQITALNQSFAIGYTYGLSGQLKTISDPFNATVTYNYDKTSRLTEVSGTNYGISTPFVSSIKYRAWGAIKEADYGYGGQLDMTYDTRLRPTQYKMTGTANGTPYARGTDYKYYADGQLKAADDLSNDVFDKSYKYDQTGRLKEALSGLEARGETVPPNTNPNRPYRQSYTYDVWGHRTGGEQRFWRANFSSQVQNNYVNNRNSGSSYDADGRELINSYNAAGRNVEHISSATVGGYPTTNPLQPAFEIRQIYNGDGAIGKREEIRRYELESGGQTTVETATTTNYYIGSSVLGGKPIVEVGTTGTQTDGYVYAAGALLAKQTGLCLNCPRSVIWQEANPLTGSRFEVNTTGGGTRQERDPLGANTGEEDPWLNYEEPNFSNIIGANQEMFLDGGSDPFNAASGCQKDGMPYDCDKLEEDVERAGVQADVFRGAMLIERVTLGAGDLIRSGGYITVQLPDIYYDVMHDFGGTDGVQPMPTTQAGGVYFVEMAVGSPRDSKGGQPPIRHPEREFFKERESIKPEQPLHCRPDIIKTMTDMWSSNAVRNGLESAEAGFTVEGTSSNYTINRAAFTYQSNELTMNITNKTSALFHSHPNKRDPRPRGDDIRIAEADPRVRSLTTQKFPVYTFTRQGLFVYDPSEPDKKKKEQKLRDGLEWQKPCP